MDRHPPIEQAAAEIGAEILDEAVARAIRDVEAGAADGVEPAQASGHRFGAWDVQGVHLKPDRPTTF